MEFRVEKHGKYSGNIIWLSFCSTVGHLKIVNLKKIYTGIDYT
jgi:hypothetical protein